MLRLKKYIHCGFLAIKPTYSSCVKPVISLDIATPQKINLRLLQGIIVFQNPFP